MNVLTKIRLAEPADRGAIEAIAAKAFAIYVERMGKKPFPMLDDYGAHIDAGHAHVLEMNGIIAAYIILIESGENVLLLDTVGVDPKCQKCGLGGKLLAFAEEEAKKRGLCRIKVYTNQAMTENIPWYEKHGYAITHRVEEHGYKRVYFMKKLA